MSQIADIAIQWITVWGLQELGWLHMWDAETPVPDLGQVTFPDMSGWDIRGHLLVEITEGYSCDLPIQLNYPLQHPSANEIENVYLKTLADAIVQSKEAPFHNLFGGALITRVDLKDWGVNRQRWPRVELRYPIGVAVHYKRVSLSGEVLDGYDDMAMLERKVSDYDVLWETHRGPVTGAIANGYRIRSWELWQAITSLVTAQERQRLGLQ